MDEDCFILHGELDPWPSKAALVGILRAGGLRAVEGEYSIRVSCCEHFVFQHLEKSPAIEADADSEEVLLRDAARVSAVLSMAGIRHRFEIYGRLAEDLVGYFHHSWPVSCQSGLNSEP